MDSLEKYIDGFCQALKVERNASPNTVRTYRTGLQEYARWAAERNLDALHPTHRQLRQFLASLSSLERTSINNRLSALRGFFSWLEITDVIDENPAAVLQGPKIHRALPSRIPPSEMDALLSVHSGVDILGRPQKQSPVDFRDQAILEFLYATGARVSEAAGLGLGAIDFDSGQVRLMGKGNKERIVPVHRRALHALRDYLEKGRPALLRPEKPTDAVFLSTRGNPMSADAIRKMFKKSLSQAGIDGDYSPHDMRHTFASDLLEGGADLRSVQEMLGHASLSTTQVYTHVSNEYLRTVHHQAHPRG
ncbi:MAG: tyrosine recombinase [Eggerthellaceae bacterium]|jgi:integrase/recombinase XerD